MISDLRDHFAPDLAECDSLPPGCLETDVAIEVVPSQQGEDDFTLVRPLNGLYVYLWAPRDEVSRKVCRAVDCASTCFTVDVLCSLPPPSTTDDGRTRGGASGGMRVPHVRVGDELARVRCADCQLVQCTVRSTVDGKVIDFFDDGETARERDRQRNRAPDQILAIVSPFGSGVDGKKRKGKGGGEE